MKGRKRLRRKKRRKGLSKKESLYGILFAVVIVSILLIYFLLFTYFPRHSNQTTQTFQFKAAIIDHLSLTQPNPAFNQNATDILKEAGWTVDYYSGEKVDVKFYKNLPTHNYGFIILRVHSALRDPEGRPSVLFTSQNYRTSEYYWEQYYERIVPVAYSHEAFERGEIYFGITPKFVKQDMEGTFVNTTIIMMGCNGLTYTEMAQALTEDKRAKVYISWSEAVSPGHTDQATIQLLENLITENKTIKEAVDEISPDPTYDSELDYYPKNAEVENYVIPEPKSNLTTNVAEINQKIEAQRRSTTMAKIMKKSEKTSIK